MGVSSTFDRPALLLLLLLVPVLWMRFRRTPGGSRTCLALKCAVFAALVVALAGPWGQMPVHRLAVTMVLDTSSSMSRESLKRAMELLGDLVRKSSNAELRLITFGEQARLETIPEGGAEANLPPSTPGMESATDVEAGLQLALATFPQQGVQRVVLVSDGNENRGSALTAALRARDQGVAIFPVPSVDSASPPVHVESVSVPQQVFSGERFPLSLRLASLRALSAQLSITCQGQEIASSPIELQQGTNAVEVEARIVGSGVSLLEVHVAGAGSDRVLFSQAVTVSRPHVLYLAGGGGPSAPLLDTLKRADVDVETRAAFPTDVPSADWDSVLLDNYPDHELPPDENAALAKYVFAGGGLIFIAGDRNSELPEEARTPFDKLLPVRGAPLTPDKPTALVLVLDKSQSMTGPKIEMARAAARDALPTLRPTDRIGVIAFDDDFRWIVPMRAATDLPRIAELVNSINADGGTRIYPPLKQAFEAVRLEKATSRHIIMLTDGVSPPGDMPQLLKDAADAHITISTVGIGADVNPEILKTIASETGGRSYLVEDPETLPQVVSGEAKKLKASSIEEVPVRAVSVQQVELTDGVDFKQMPRLLGFVKAKAKEGSETILRLDRGEPLLVRWHYGLGRVIAFMSDARSRWAANWVASESFGTFWPQMVRDVSSRDRDVRAGVRAGTRTGEEIVSYDVLPNPDNEGGPDFEQFGIPSVVVASPGTPVDSLALEETSPHHFEARIPASQSGLYRIASGSAGVRLPAAGFYRESEEHKPRAINVELLRQISSVSRGAMNPTVDQLLDDEGTLVVERRPLWPYWLVVALAINFLEVAIRKGYFRRLRA